MKFPIQNFERFKKTVLILTSISLAVLFVSCSGKKESKYSKNAITINVNEYGFSDDSLNVDTTKVKINETFADVLLPFNVPYLTILKMASVDKNIFDARKVVAGNKFLIYTKKDTSKKLCCIVYEKDPINYVIFDFGDALRTIEGKKKVTRKERTVSGVIDNSLFATIAEQNVSTNLALNLADIFAWQIDFYRIRKGDYFKVIFDEIYINNKLYTVGKIKSALFHHFKKDYFAFYFNQVNKLDYFDENGNSLRKAFLRAPLKFSRISSRYSMRRYHPVFHKYRAHRGIDFAAPIGTLVHSIGDGIVTAAKYKRGNGFYIKVKHNSTYQSGYLHLSRFAKGIKPGKSVKQGQTIGYVGMTGFSTGPHLDLRFWKNGQLVNYLKMEFPPSKPIEKKYRDEFIKTKDIYLARLNSMLLNNNVADTNHLNSQK